MARKRFNATGRGILSRGRGTAIEWQNVTRWHAGTLTGEGIRTEDGWQHSYAITHENAGKGRAYPRHARTYPGASTERMRRWPYRFTVSAMTDTEWAAS